MVQKRAERSSKDKLLQREPEVFKNPVEMVGHMLDLESRHFLSFNQKHSYSYLSFLLRSSKQKHILHIRSI